MSRSVENWRRVIRDHERDDHGLAQHVLGDLVGYRDSSVHRGDDRDQLATLFSAIRLEWEHRQAAATKPGGG